MFTLCEDNNVNNQSRPNVNRCQNIHLVPRVSEECKLDVKNKEVLKAKNDDVRVESVCYSENVSQDNDSWVKILKKKYKKSKH